MGPTTGEESGPLDPITPGDASGEVASSRRLAKAEADAERLRAHADGAEYMAAKIVEQRAEIARINGALASLESKRVVRTGRQLSRLLGRARALAGRGARTAALTEVGPAARFPRDIRYPEWVARYDTLDDTTREHLRRRISQLHSPPLISFILPVYNTPEHYLRDAIDSIRAQLYTNWELCVADDCSSAAWVPKVLAEYAAEDPRIRTVRLEANSHISASSNAAIALASGEWLALVDHDDVVPEHALAVAVLSLEGHPDAGVLYSDEDHIDDDGRRFDPYFKSDFDPLLLLGQNYLSHFVMLRRSLVQAVGGFREGYEGSQDWDLMLRVTEALAPAQVIHVPHVLYHWRTHEDSTASSLSAKPYAVDAARRAVADHLGRTGRAASVQSIGGLGFNRVLWHLPDPVPKVSIVLLHRSGPRFISSLDSVKVRTTYPDYEIVVVDDGAHRPPFREFLRDRSDWVSVVRVDRDCSDGALRNAAARAATGSVLCFLDDDVEVITTYWLESMVSLVIQPGIGAVGAKLLYPNGTIEHAGVVAGIGSTVGHPHRRSGWLEPGYFGRLLLTQSYSAVSWACMVVRREAFEAVGGFAEDQFSGAYADVDLCLRLGDAGWRIGWTPSAELIHHESADDPRESEGENATRFARDIRHLQRRWRTRLDHDPAYNPNLTLAHENFALAWPPRASYLDL